MTETPDKPAIPPPGSDAALDAGCTCPVLDNGRGRGYLGQKGVYVMTLNCPLHGEASRQKEETK